MFTLEILNKEVA